jgi:hypothetical protein
VSHPGSELWVQILTYLLGVNIAAVVIKVIEDYEITERVGFFVLDNAENNDVAVKTILKQLRPDTDPKQRRIRCAGHVINLVAQAFLGGTDEKAFEYGDDPEATETLLKDEVTMLNTWRKEGPIGKLHYLVRYIRLTPQRRKEFMDIKGINSASSASASALASAKEVMVIQNNATRWNSTCSMIERAIKVQERLDQFTHQALFKKDHPITQQEALSTEDWHILKLVLQALQPLKQITKILEGKNPSAERGSLSQVIPLFERLMAHLEELNDRYFKRVAYEDGNPTNLPDEEEYLGTSTNNAWIKLNNYYGKTDESFAYVAALAMNPNIKIQYLEDRWKHQPDWIADAKKRISEAWESWVKEEAKLWNTSASTSSPEATIPIEAPDDFFDYLNWVPTHQSGDISSRISTELNSYLYGNTRPLRKAENKAAILETPIQWWVAHKEVYPNLFYFALTLLSIPAMSAECERVFSSSKLLVTDRRNLLHEDTIEAVECERSWNINGII